MQKAPNFLVVIGTVPTLWKEPNSDHQVYVAYQKKEEIHQMEETTLLDGIMTWNTEAAQGNLKKQHL